MAKNLTAAELSGAFRELSFLLHAGVGIGDGLTLLAGDRRGREQEILRTAAARCDEGLSLSEALRRAGGIPDYALGMIDAGEQSGRLEQCLMSLSEYYLTRQRMAEYARSALTYPALLLVLMAVIIGVLLVKVLPAFENVYQSLGGEMAGLAGALAAFGRMLGRGLPVILIAAACLAAAVCVAALCSGLRARVRGLWRRHFGDRGAARKVNDAHFAQVLALGMASGLSPERSLEMCRELFSDTPQAQKRCAKCLELLESGAELGDACGQAGILPAAESRLLSLGMKSGAGESAIAGIAARLEEDAQRATEKKISRIEPIMVLVTSLLVGAILLSVMLPLMNIMTAIG